MLIGVVWGWPVTVAVLIHWFYVLIRGRRSERLWNFIAGYIRFAARAWAYMAVLTDERPPITGRAIPLE